MKKINIFLMLIATIILTFVVGCSDAAVASNNLSVRADNFEINRRIVFFNGITDTYMLTIEGRCSLTNDSIDKQLEVTCKTADSTYKKHYLGLSDNVTYFVEQTEDKAVDVYAYRIVFKPSAIIPNIQIK